MPQGTGRVVEYFCVDLLPTKARVFILRKDLLDEGRGEVRTIFIRIAAGDERAGRLEQIANDLRGSRRRGDHNAWVRSETQPEAKLIPRFGIPPGCELVAPRVRMLWAAKSVGFV